MNNKFPMKMSVKDGVLLYEDGSEVTLWGDNFQPNLYWEYKFRMEHMGIPMTSDIMKSMCDDGFRDLNKMGSNIIRCHLTPSDFTDSNGNLVNTMWLDLLGYLIDQASRNGIYVYLTFMNQMEYTFVKDSFVPKYSREEWIFDKSCVDKTKNMVCQLVNWTNPYNQIKLKQDSTICVWELINEPEYLKYHQITLDADHAEDFKAWADENRVSPDDINFSKFRYLRVKEYIDSFHQLLRDEGAEQPLIWNCNWPRMITENKDVFNAISDSKADGISFCLYPGQDDVGEPFMEHPADLSKNNYLPFLHKCFDDYEHLGWLQSDQFTNKAKLVYEFETMYNEKSSYLHPAMAKLFRAVGVQIATMWTHCFNIYSSHMGCAHNLNIKTTPKKAIGFIIAGRVFNLLPRKFDFQTSTNYEDISDEYALSFDHGISLLNSKGEFMHSDSIKWNPINLPNIPNRIIGYGSSPFVTCKSKGLFFIDIENEQVSIELYPQAVTIRDGWRWYADGKEVTKLDEKTVIDFKLSLPGYEPVHFTKKPGSYIFSLVSLNENSDMN